MAVFILDEADRLTDAAANALLKVLEEPPPEVAFVLVARSTEALLATIPSRARMLSFATLPPATVTTRSPPTSASVPSRPPGPPRPARPARPCPRPARRRAHPPPPRQHARPGGAARRRPGVRRAGGRDGHRGPRRRGGRRAQGAAGQGAGRAGGGVGTGRGTGTIRKRLETRHRRELRRLRFDAIRDAVADLLAAYRDLALLGAGGPPDRLVHADRAATFERLAAAVDPAAAIRAAGVLEEAAAAWRSASRPCSPWRPPSCRSRRPWPAHESP